GTEMIYLCMTHESCDLDSVVSTLAIAYLRYCNKGGLPQFYAPVLDMQRKDYPVKTEVCFLLGKQGIKPEIHLIFRDDLPEELLLKSRFILINHHVSPFHFGTEEVYDYRSFQSQAARLPTYCQRVMYPVRSCAALAAARYSNSMSNSASVRCIRVFELLHAALLLTNRNFITIPVAKLCHLQDYRMMLFLERYLGKLKDHQRTILYNSLVNSIFDMRHLTLPQILRREFKILKTTRYMKGVKSTLRVVQCCFPMALTRFIAFENAELAIREFAAHFGCSFVLMLGTSIRPGGSLVVKELAVIPVDGLIDLEHRRFFDHLIINLCAANKPQLDLEPYRNLDYMQGGFFFVNAWNVGPYTVLDLLQRAAYDYITEGGQVIK
ncbi:hypothetical protein KR026_002145, partial [Drosophila bipectinata]